MSRAILDAVQSPVEVKAQRNGTFRYEGASATVVLNQDGFVVIMWAIAKEDWRRR